MSIDLGPSPQGFSEKDRAFMAQTLELARQGAQKGEVPVGAVLVLEDQIIAQAYNHKETQPCALDHAEIIAIRRASQQLGRWRLTDCTLYVSLEPCLMCAGAIVSSRLKRLVFATRDPKAGAVCSLYHCLTDSRLNHQVQVEEGLLAQESSQLLKNFFKERRLTSST